MPAPKGNKYAKGNPNSGRPTEYRSWMPKATLAYLHKHEDKISKNGKLTCKLPTLQGLAVELGGVTMQTLHDWAKQSEVFSLALGKVVKAQHDRLVQKGLSGDYNSTIAKLILSSNHGYAEKTEQKHSGEIVVTAEKVEEIKKALLDT